MRTYVFSIPENSLPVFAWPKYGLPGSLILAGGPEWAGGRPPGRRRVEPDYEEQLREARRRLILKEDDDLLRIIMTIVNRETLY
jgi:hypothetical protein